MKSLHELGNVDRVSVAPLVPSGGIRGDAPCLNRDSSAAPSTGKTS